MTFGLNTALKIATFAYERFRLPTLLATTLILLTLHFLGRDQLARFDFPPLAIGLVSSLALLGAVASAVSVLAWIFGASTTAVRARVDRARAASREAEIATTRETWLHGRLKRLTESEVRLIKHCLERNDRCFPYHPLRLSEIAGLLEDEMIYRCHEADTNRNLAYCFEDATFAFLMRNADKVKR